MEFENREEIDGFIPSYNENFYNSFESVVEAIYTEEEKERIVLCDIDGVLFGNMDKIPGYSLLNKSVIPDDIQNNLWFLREEFGDKLIIVTNRNPDLNLFLSSKYIIDRTREVTDPNGPELKIFHSLYKQFPVLGKKEKEEVLNYIGNICKEIENLTITSIEDWSIVSLNRKIYLLSLANSLYEKFGIKSNIENYVIQK